METNQSKTASRSKSKKSTSKKPASTPPRASARAKRAAAASADKKKPTGASAKRSAPNGAERLSPEQRAQQIAMAAYFLAERRGFAPNHELDDWLAAERSL